MGGNGRRGRQYDNKIKLINKYYKKVYIVIQFYQTTIVIL